MKWIKTLYQRVQSRSNQEAEALRRVQALGLKGASRSAAVLLREKLPEEHEFLRPWQVETLRVLQSRMCRPDGEDLPGPGQIGALDRSLRYLRHMPGDTREQMSQILALVEVGPLFLGPSRWRFTALRPEEQDVYIQGWADSSVPARRALFRALKSVCVMGYWSHPGTWGAIGYSVARNPGVPASLRASFEEEEA